MILGIAGAAGAGKDTLASILVQKHGFVSLAFADPIKRAARDLFGFTNLQLWGPSEKRNEPDERYPRTHGTHVWKRAQDPAMFECVACKWVVPAHLEGPYEKPCASYLTPREVLQKLGTEVGRACYPNIWVERTLRDAKSLISGVEKTSCPPQRCAYSPTRGLYYKEAARYIDTPKEEWYVAPTHAVITDVRFANEIDALKEEGYVVRIVRDAAGLPGQAGQHQSETELASLPHHLFDDVIVNNGTLDDLELKATQLLARLK